MNCDTLCALQCVARHGDLIILEVEIMMEPLCPDSASNEGSAGVLHKEQASPQGSVDVFVRLRTLPYF